MEAAGEQESLCEIRQSTGAIGCGLSPPENVIVAISAELENRAVIKCVYFYNIHGEKYIFPLSSRLSTR